MSSLSAAALVYPVMNGCVLLQAVSSQHFACHPAMDDFHRVEAPGNGQKTML